MRRPQMHRAGGRACPFDQGLPNGIDIVACRLDGADALVPGLSVTSLGRKNKTPLVELHEVARREFRRRFKPLSHTLNDVAMARRPTLGCSCERTHPLDEEVCRWWRIGKHQDLQIFKRLRRLIAHVMDGHRSLQQLRMCRVQAQRVADQGQCLRQFTLSHANAAEQRQGLKAVRGRSKGLQLRTGGRQLVGLKVPPGNRQSLQFGGVGGLERGVGSDRSRAVGRNGGRTAP